MFHCDPIRSGRDHEQAGRAKWRESQTICNAKVTIHLRHAGKSRINKVLVVVSSNGHWMVQQVRSPERYARFETGGNGEKQVTRIKRKARRNEEGRRGYLVAMCAHTRWPLFAIFFFNDTGTKQEGLNIESLQRNWPQAKALFFE